MQPNDNRQLNVASRTPPHTSSSSDRDRAAAIMREQINRIYDEPTKTPPHADPVNPSNPYEKTHSDDGHTASAAQWQRYHSAWQQYYQQYYDRYYRSHHAQLVAASASTAAQTVPAQEVGVTEDVAVEEIKNSLRANIESQTKKIRKSRHFVPVISALVVMSLFLFLQYNRAIIAQVKSFVSPGSIAAQNVIVDPAASLTVPPEPRIVIPKINVDAPVVYEVPSLDEPVVQDALKDGVIHYPIPGASSMPGELGNAVFMGHSSNDVFDDGDYKFIFVQLEQLKTGDKFYIHYNQTRYTYTIRATEVILPTEVSKLILPADKPLATLVTCTPVGTSEKRFVVYAEQISPDPTQATVATPQPTESSQPASISGNSPTLFDRLFGF